MPETTVQSIETSFGAASPFFWVSSQVTVSCESESSSAICPGECPSEMRWRAFAISSSSEDMERGSVTDYLCIV